MIFTLDHVTLDVEVVTTPAAQQQGLSGRPFLAKNSGMLFVFPEVGYHAFWMKQMLFPLDIIWMDENYRVVYVAHNAQPCTVSDCPIYSPTAPAKYVLEVTPGTFQGLQ